MKNKCEPNSWLLRLFSISWSTLFVLLSVAFARIFPATQYWAAAALIAGLFLTGVIWPVAMRRPYRIMERTLSPLGELISLFVLMLVYFGIFTPCGLLLRLMGWDPLGLRGKRSVWQPRPVVSSKNRFFWQY